MAFARRDEFVWQLRTRSLELGKRTLLMGVLNVTPDSFSDGNLFVDLEAATARALRMLDDGADIVDIGGESTRPGRYVPVTAEEEQRRALPVIEAVLKARPDAVLSIDTYKASTAEAAVNAGAEIANDISALSWDTEMAETCAWLACGVVLMLTRGKSAEWRNLPPLAPEEVTPLVKRELAQSLLSALEAGIEIIIEIIAEVDFLERIVGGGGGLGDFGVYRRIDGGGGQNGGNLSSGNFGIAGFRGLGSVGPLDLRLAHRSVQDRLVGVLAITLGIGFQ